MAIEGSFVLFVCFFAIEVLNVVRKTVVKWLFNLSVMNLSVNINSHRWLEAATLDSTDVDHAHYHCRFYWTMMLMFSVPSLWASWCSGWCGEKHWQNGYKLGH